MHKESADLQGPMAKNTKNNKKHFYKLKYYQLKKKKLNQKLK